MTVGMKSWCGAFSIFIGNLDAGSLLFSLVSLFFFAVITMVLHQLVRE